MDAKKGLLALVLGLLIAGGGCGSGGSGGPVKSGLAAGFTPDEPSPGSTTVAMAENVASGDTVTVDVTVTDTDGISGVSFDVDFNSAHASFVGWSEGTLLEQGGVDPIYQVSSPQPGKIVVVVTRMGDPVVDANGTMPVIRLVFQVNTTGGSAVTFQANNLLGQPPFPPPIPGVDWYGGSLTGI